MFNYRHPQRILAFKSCFKVISLRDWKTNLPKLLGVHTDYVFHLRLSIESRVKCILIYGSGIEIIQHKYFLEFLPRLLPCIKVWTWSTKGLHSVLTEHPVALHTFCTASSTSSSTSFSESPFWGFTSSSLLEFKSFLQNICKKSKAQQITETCSNLIIYSKKTDIIRNLIIMAHFCQKYPVSKHLKNRVNSIITDTVSYDLYTTEQTLTYYRILNANEKSLAFEMKY